MTIREARELTINEIIEAIDNAVSWDAIDVEVYEYACEQLGLNYHDYDDPDRLFEDMKEAAANK